MEEAPVLMDTDAIVNDESALGQTELHLTMSNLKETNDNKAEAPLNKCDVSEVSEHGEAETKIDMLAPAHMESNTNVHTTEKQISPTDGIEMQLTEESSQDDYSTDHRHGRHLTNIFVPDVGNKWYDVKGNLVTRPIDPKKLPNAFGYLPIYGRPKSKANLAEFQDERIREFVGFDLGDQEFDNLAQYCR